MAKAKVVDTDAQVVKARSQAQRIIKGMKWQSPRPSQLQRIFLNGDDYNYKIGDIAKWRRVEVLSDSCFSIDSNGDYTYLSNGNHVELIPALLIRGEYFNEYVWLEKEILKEVSLDDDDIDENDVPRWESQVMGVCIWSNFSIYPDGTLSIGCQRHSFDKWMRRAKSLLGPYDNGDGRNKEYMAALEQLLPMCQEFIDTHPIPVGKKNVQRYSLAEIKEMISARYREPVVTKPVKKAARKKTTKK